MVDMDRALQDVEIRARSANEAHSADDDVSEKGVVGGVEEHVVQDAAGSLDAQRFEDSQVRQAGRAESVILAVGDGGAFGDEPAEDVHFLDGVEGHPSGGDVVIEIDELAVEK